MKKRTPSHIFKGWILVKGRISELREKELTWPRRSGRYRGTSIGRDKNGYFVCTHRCRSKSYPKASKIPKSKIAFIRSTG